MWIQQELNLRQPRYRRGALPTELWNQKCGVDRIRTCVGRAAAGFTIQPRCPLEYLPLFELAFANSIGSVDAHERAGTGNADLISLRIRPGSFWALRLIAGGEGHCTCRLVDLGEGLGLSAVGSVLRRWDSNPRFSGYEPNEDNRSSTSHYKDAKHSGDFQGLVKKF